MGLKTTSFSEGETTKLGDLCFIGVLVAYSLADDLDTFLATHPVPISVINTVNGFLGYGLDIPATKTRFGRELKIALEDLTSSQ